MSTRTANANPVTAIAPLAILPIELVAQSWSCSVDAVIAGGIDSVGITLEGSSDPFRHCGRSGGREEIQTHVAPWLLCGRRDLGVEKAGAGPVRRSPEQLGLGLAAGLEDRGAAWVEPAA